MLFNELPEFDAHETVISFFDKSVGLRGFIAIHNTANGPATGGTRYAYYASETEALRDALRLSRAMTYKCALADVPYGGGKAVIIRDTDTMKSKAFLKAYVRQINLLDGHFYTGQDVGMTKADIATMRQTCPFIGGTKSGDLGQWASLGVFYGMKAAALEVFGSASLRGHTVAVKGLGKLGFSLCELVYEEGGKLFISDIDSKTLDRAKHSFPDAIVVDTKAIHRQSVDIYSPCAYGSEFNKKTVNELRCALICGGANNQLSSREDGVRLHELGIVYIPDYLANAGGLISVMDEQNKGGYDRARVVRKVKNIGRTTRKLVQRSASERRATSELADQLAESIFKKKSREAAHLVQL